MAAMAVSGCQPARPAADPQAVRAQMPYRTLGRTNERVSLIGLGGFHIGQVKDDRAAIRILRTAIDSGVTFMDNSWDYHNGRSEKLMGQALRDGYRARVFLMTKFDGRDRETAARQIDESLARLETDYVDLLQFHEIIRADDPEWIFSAGGAMEAAVAARKAGKCRYIGFTGHKLPAFHLKMLEIAKRNRFQFDTMQIPLSLLDTHFSSFEKEVLPAAVEQKLGIVGMKSLSNAELLKLGTVSPRECMQYAMNLPVSTLVVGIDEMRYLDEALQAAVTFQPMKAEQVALLRSRTLEAAKDGRHEKYKTTTLYDMSSRFPHYLGKQGKTL